MGRRAPPRPTSRNIAHASFGSERVLSAIVDIDNEVRGVKTMPSGIPVPRNGIVKTQLMEVFARHGERWWIEAYHNVDTKPPN